MLKPHGFTLIEVLVTLIILMFGLLGVAGLMAKGQRVSFEAYQRQQALQIAGEMAERLRANRAQAAAYLAAVPLPAGVGSGSQYTDLVGGSLSPNCGTSSCTAAQLVPYDIAVWVGLLQGYGETTAGATPVGGILNPRGCIEVATVVAGGTPANTYRVSVSWQGNEDTGTAATRSSTCGTGLYGGEGLRRVASLDVLMF